jgi:hypothetical protein
MQAVRVPPAQSSALFAFVFPLCAFASLALSACSGASDATSPPGSASQGSTSGEAGPCTATVPSSCPTAAPTWSADAMPIFESHCWSCHAGDGIESSQYPFGSYSAIYQARTTILEQLSLCNMPPSDAPTALTSDERETLLTWLACGAPND